MNAKLEHALRRLQRILPLEARQKACSKQIRELHQLALRSFVSKGRMLTREEMAQHVGDLGEAIEVLRSSEMVLFSENGDPVGAYPFTTEQREHQVLVDGHRVHAMCALDALAVSPMFAMQTRISSRCRITGDPVNIRQSGNAIENPDEARDIHLGIAWGAAHADSRCADSLCMQMIFLRDGKIARQWHADDFGDRETFTLPEAVEFAGRFFVPLVAS